MFKQIFMFSCLCKAEKNDDSVSVQEMTDVADEQKRETEKGNKKEEAQNGPHKNEKKRGGTPLLKNTKKSKPD